MNRSAVHLGLLAALGWVALGGPRVSAETGETGVGASITSTFKSGVNKVTEAFAPKKPAPEPPDPISLATKATPSAELYVAAARVAEQAGKPAEAEANYQQALKINPRYLPALVSYARMKDRQGELTAATGLYQEAAKLYPQEASVLNDLGLCFERRKMFREAAAALEQAVRLQPDRKLYRNNLAVVMVEMGDLDGAFVQFRAVYSEAISYYNLGYLLAKQGKTREAARLFAESLRKDPSLVEAKIWLERLGGQLESSQPPPRIAQHAAQAGQGQAALSTGRTLQPEPTNLVRQLPAVSPSGLRSGPSAPSAPLPPSGYAGGAGVSSPSRQAAPVDARIVVPSGPAVLPPETQGRVQVLPLPPVAK